MSRTERGNSLIVIIVLGLLIIGAIAAIWKNNATARKIEENSKAFMATTTVPVKVIVPKTVNVTYTTGSGFSPATTTLNVGDTLVFTNKSNNSFWPQLTKEYLAAYAEFDSRKPVLPGQSFSVVISKSGELKFADHLRPTRTGVVIAK